MESEVKSEGGEARKRTQSASKAQASSGGASSRLLGKGMRKRAPVSYKELLSQPLGQFGDQVTESKNEHKRRAVRHKPLETPAEPTPRTRKPKRKAPSASSASQLEGFNGVVGKVRSALASIRRNQSLIDVYERDYNSELVKPEQDILHANMSIRRLKRKIRNLVREVEEHYKDKPHLHEASWDPDGIDVELVTCSICGGGDSSETNDVLLCDREGCNRAFHQLCLSPPVLDTATLPEDWFCPACDCALDCIDEVNYNFDSECTKATDLFSDVDDVSDQDSANAASLKTSSSRHKRIRTSTSDTDNDNNNNNNDTSNHSSTNSHNSSGDSDSNSNTRKRPQRKAGKQAMNIVSSLLKHHSTTNITDTDTNTHNSSGSGSNAQSAIVVRDPVVRQLLSEVNNSDDDDADFETSHAACPDDASDSDADSDSNSDSDSNTNNPWIKRPRSTRNAPANRNTSTHLIHDNTDSDTNKNNKNKSKNKSSKDSDSDSDSDSESNGSLDSFDNVVLMSDSLGRGKRCRRKPDYAKLWDTIKLEGKSTVFAADEDDSDFDPASEDSQA